MKSDKYTVEVIIPIFNEEESIPSLVEKLIIEREYCQDRFKDCKISVCFINDGSTDNSLNLLKLSLDNNANFKVINLSRNFDHQGATFSNRVKSA